MSRIVHLVIRVELEDDTSVVDFVENLDYTVEYAGVLDTEVVKCNVIGRGDK